jgi:hypothetical protein
MNDTGMVTHKADGKPRAPTPLPDPAALLRASKLLRLPIGQPTVQFLLALCRE